MGGTHATRQAKLFGLIRFRNSWILEMVSETDSSFGLTLPSCRSFKIHTARSSSIHISMVSCLESISEAFKTFRLPSTAWLLLNTFLWFSCSLDERSALAECNNLPQIRTFGCVFKGGSGEKVQVSPSSILQLLRALCSLSIAAHKPWRATFWHWLTPASLWMAPGSFLCARVIAS